ncbi:MAG: DEAD/DEAH box helicase [Desulfosarcina sp.]
MKFTSFSFHSDVLRGAADAGYVTPTPIQEQAIPEVMQGRDLMGLAQTGTGKTAAFALPILNRLLNRQIGRLQSRSPKKTERRVGALIIAPTRELAEQIHCAVKTLGRHTHLRTTAVYGGVGINPQIQALMRADIVVGCPGRLLDHLNRGTLDLSRLEMLVLDEADQMFDMGFFPDIRRILSHTPADNRQTLLFSATMPKVIRDLAHTILKQPVTVKIGTTAPAETVSHALFPVAPHLKTALLIKLLGQPCTGSVLVFTRTKFRARSLGEKLSRAGFRSTSIQGNLSQGRRQAAMDGFRSGEFRVLVATDIAARGIDVANVSHVINYDIPTTPEAYIHRIGRTGRAMCSGEAFSLVTREDASMVAAINRTMGSRVEQRTLTDFNYEAPLAQPGQKAGGSANRQRPTGGRKMVSSRRTPRRRAS